MRVGTALLGVALTVLGSASHASPRFESVEIGGEAFRLELAADPMTRTIGLMGRSEIAPHGGMLFIFPDTAPRSFWMRNCLVDLDIAYLDDEGRVVAVHRMKAEPLRQEGESESDYLGRLARYPSAKPARYAIELRAGSLARLGVAAGDRIELGHIPLPTS